jgi:hypothetical protein
MVNDFDGDRALVPVPVPFPPQSQPFVQPMLHRLHQ